ncbi:MAG: hypothetical protein D6741_16485 [Planctomycetota bacterium]|nr:MAG: hypothetical protein D6741_16485 [Planctomycetota bacterium]
MNVRVLSASDVAKALPMREAIEAMREAFASLAAGEAIVPERARIDVAEPPGTALFMPAYSAKAGAVTVKTVSLFPQNRERGLPLISGLVCVFDGETGSPRALLEAASLTAIRTGAVSGLATDLLASPDAETAAVFGAGTQGRTQLQAVCAVRPIRRAWVYDVSPAAAERFAREMAESLSIDVQVADCPTCALKESRIVCTATVSDRPVFADDAVLPGVHINAVGSYKRTVQEIPDETVARSWVVVDHRPAAMAEAGDILGPLDRKRITPDHIRAELGELVRGSVSPPGNGAVTLFKSVGVAVQDLFAAVVALRNAERMNLGTTISL